MDKYCKIALATKEKSIKELHQKILDLLKKQPPEVNYVIQQLIDYYQKIILCMPGNVYWMDKTSHTVGCNQKVLDMFGLQEFSDFDNLSFEDMARIGSWTEEQGNSFKRDTLEVINTGVPKMNIEEPPIPSKDGSLLYFLSSRMPLFNSVGDVIGVVGISTDITHQKMTEKALEKANHAKSEFLANLSHDIRTPLASIVSLTEHLNNKIEDKELKDIAYDTQSCAEQVLLLIDEILEITEIDLGKTQSNELAFSIKELITSIDQLMSSAAKQKNLSFSYTVDDKVPDILWGKRQLLHRILLNLTSNAIKFTKQGYVKINVTLLSKTNSDIEIQIDVSDSGIGIPEEVHEKIFEQFERLGSAYENQYEGRGLGLYIVKQFLNLIGGKIKVKSHESNGSTFSVQLPLRIATEHEEKSVMENTKLNIKKANKPIAQSRNENNLNLSVNHLNDVAILLVEDTEIARKAAIITLAPFNCAVDTAKNGREAIDYASSKRYDIILLDIGLPDISGIEVAKKIRENELKNNIVPVPIIALTAHLAQSAIQQCINAGIQQVIRKPLTSTRADSLLNNWLEGIYKSSKKSIPVDKKENELYPQFINDLINNKKLLSLAYQSKSREKLSEVVHIIHGAARFLHLPPLQKACNSLESAIADDFSEEEIHALYEDLMNAIQNLINNNSKSNGTILS